jgi:hypothetical protein
LTQEASIEIDNKRGGVAASQMCRESPVDGDQIGIYPPWTIPGARWIFLHGIIRGLRPLYDSPYFSNANATETAQEKSKTLCYPWPK